MADPVTVDPARGRATPQTAQRARLIGRLGAEFRAGDLTFALLLLTGICYGLNYSLARVAVTGGVPFAAYVFWMGIGAAVVMLLLALPTRRLPPASPRYLFVYAVTGISGYGVPFLVVALVSAKGVPAGILSILVALSPILTYGAALIFRLERFWWVRFMGLFVGTAGVVVLVVPETSLPSPDLVPWILVALLMPLGYTTTGISTALMRPPQTDSRHFGAGYFFFGALPLGIAMIVSGEYWWFTGGMDGPDWALILAIFSQGLGIYLFVELIRLRGPVFFSSVNFIVPPAGIVWGILFFGEDHSLWVWLALVFLMAGVLFVIQRRKSDA